MANLIQKRTACNRDCPDACGLIATIDDNRVVKLQGDPDHPVTQGFLCHRTSRFLERQYDPDRVITPLKRNGNEFLPVSWDEALNLIAEKMKTIKDESGPAAIMHYRCGGAMGLMKHVTDYFFEQFGPVTIKSGDICAGAGDAAQTQDFGDSDSNDLFDLLNSKSIVLWGKNPYVSQVHLLPILKEAKRNGARLALIDPVHHRTADMCELYLQPQAGGDIALALGVARYLFENDLHDPQSPEYCDNFDEFRALAFSRSPDEWAQLAGVPADQIAELATLYSSGPSAILVGWGMQRRTNGCATIRTVDALAAITGNMGIPGGGASFYFKRRGAFDLSFAKYDKVAPRTIPEPLLGPGILEAADPPIRMVWVTAANPVAMLPQSKTVREALQSREFTVVVDSFLTDTARCADLVLPTTTMLEDDDLLGAYGHHWLVEMQPVIDAPDEVKTDYEIVQQLAPRVGLNGDFAQDVDTWKRRMLSPVADQGASLDDLRKGAARNPLSKEVFAEGRKFNTPSGRMDLIHEVDPLPTEFPAERPLCLMSLSTEKSQASQWVHGEDDGPITATVHPEAAVGFEDGDCALVRSAISELTVTLKFDEKQRRDVVLIPKGGWLREGRCANALIEAKLTDEGECAVYYDTSVCILPITQKLMRDSDVSPSALAQP